MSRKSFLLALVALGCAAAAPAQQVAKADLLLLHGNVITLNPGQPAAQAVAVAGGRILWTGSDAEAKRIYVGAAQTVDLGGATVLPGIIDAHTHLLSLGQSFTRLNVKDVPTPDQVAERVRERAKKTPAGEWILGWGWDEGAWASHYPDHKALDEAAPNNPVFLSGLHGYAAWVNQRALDAADINKETKDPENGQILRDASGNATGVLTNKAQPLVGNHIPPPTLEQTKEALAVAARECVRNGLTSVGEATVSPTELEAFRVLIREGRMPLHVYIMIDGADKKMLAEWMKKGPELDRTNRLTVRAVKLFADGALGSRGAALFEPYADAPGTKGVLVNSETDLYNITRESIEKGFQVCTHAIGDAANHITLNAYERAMKDTGKGGEARLRIEHAQVLAPADIPRFAQLRVLASMQPAHCTSDMPWAEKRLGPVRVKGAYAWRAVLETGAHEPLSSDFPGETLNPLWEFYSAVTRQDHEGKPAGGWHPEQRLTIEEALRGYTREAAYAQFEENDKGSIETGKLADFTVVSRDVTKITARDLLSTRVLRTVVAGETVYQENARN